MGKIQPVKKEHIVNNMSKTVTSFQTETYRLKKKYKNDHGWWERKSIEFKLQWIVKCQQHLAINTLINVAYIDMGTITPCLLKCRTQILFFLSDKRAVETIEICRDMRLINTQSF